MSRRRLTLILAIVGAGTLFGAGVTAVREGIMPTELLLLMLALPAAWLRINMEPTGDITLVPVVIFVAFVSARPHVPLLVATLAAIVGTSLFSRQSSGEALRAAGEEAIPVWASIGLLRVSVLAPLTSRSWQIELVLAILTYAVVRLGIMSLRARITEGMEFRSFLVTCGRSVLANLGFFALVALGLNYLTRGHGNAGYLTLALATIALVEAYHPYKLLSDQRDVLFASLAMIAQAIESASRAGKPIGICGQAPSDYPEFAAWLVERGISSISLNPDTAIKTAIIIAKAEAKLLPHAASTCSSTEKM